MADPESLVDVQTVSNGDSALSSLDAPDSLENLPPHDSSMDSLEPVSPTKDPPDVSSPNKDSLEFNIGQPADPQTQPDLILSGTSLADPDILTLDLPSSVDGDSLQEIIENEFALRLSQHEDHPADISYDSIEDASDEILQMDKAAGVNIEVRVQHSETITSSDMSPTFDISSSDMSYHTAYTPRHGAGDGLASSNTLDLDHGVVGSPTDLDVSEPTEEAKSDFRHDDDNSHTLLSSSSSSSSDSEQEERTPAVEEPLPDVADHQNATTVDIGDATSLRFISEMKVVDYSGVPAVTPSGSESRTRKHSSGSSSSSSDSESVGERRSAGPSPTSPQQSDLSNTECDANQHGFSCDVQTLLPTVAEGSAVASNEVDDVHSGKVPQLVRSDGSSSSSSSDSEDEGKKIIKHEEHQEVVSEVESLSASKSAVLSQESEHVSSEPEIISQERTDAYAEQEIPTQEGAHLSPEPEVISQEITVMSPKLEILTQDRADSSPEPEVISQERAVSSPEPEVISQERAETSSEPEVISQERAVSSPEPEVISQHRADTSPEPEVISQQRADSSPEPEVISQERAVSFPELETISHEQADLSPEPEVISQEITDTSPKLEILTQERADLSQEPEVISQERADSSPEPEVISQERADSSPEPEVISQERADASPEPEVISQERADSSPEPEVISLERAVSSPEPEVISQEGAVSSPEPEVISQERADSSPEPEVISQERADSSPEPEVISQERAVSSPEPEVISQERAVSSPEPVIIAQERADAPEPETITQERADSSPEPEVLAKKRPPDVIVYPPEPEAPLEEPEPTEQPPTPEKSLDQVRSSSTEGSSSSSSSDDSSSNSGSETKESAVVRGEDHKKRLVKRKKKDDKRRKRKKQQQPTGEGGEQTEVKMLNGHAEPANEVRLHDDVTTASTNQVSSSDDEEERALEKINVKVLTSSYLDTTQHASSSPSKEHVETGVSIKDIMHAYSDSPSLSSEVKPSEDLDLHVSLGELRSKYSSSTAKEEHVSKETVATGVSIRNLCSVYSEHPAASSTVKADKLEDEEEKILSSINLRTLRENYANATTSHQTPAGTETTPPKDHVTTGVSIRQLRNQYSKSELELTKYNRVSRHFNQQTPSLDQTNNCQLCGKQVFQMEQIKAEKKIWHKNCFRCKECQKQLTFDVYNSHEGELYCKPHFKQLFQPKVILDNPDDQTQVPQKKHEMIIKESQPMELPDSVVRSSDKADYGLEELSNLNVKSRFQMFEGASKNEESTELQSVVGVKRSSSILSKLAKFQSKGMETGVDNNELNGIPLEETTSEESEGEGSDEDGEVVKSSRKKKEQPVSFAAMGEVRSLFEKTQQEKKEDLLQTRREQHSKFRTMICLGKNQSLRAVFENGTAEDEDATPHKEIDIHCERSNSIREQFEKGNVIGSDDEIKEEEEKKKKEEEMSVFQEAGTAKGARNLFKELDASAPKVPVQNMAPNVKRSQSDIKRVRDGDSPDREIYHDPNVVRSDDRIDDDIYSDTASRVINKFREMEESVGWEDEAGPKPLKCFTPPPEDTKYSDSEEEYTEEYDDDEEYEEEDYDSEEDDGIVRSSDKIEDDFLKKAHSQNSARAQQLRAKFEKWEEHVEKENELNQSEREDITSSLDTAKNLKAKFEAMRVESMQPKEKPKSKVNRFI